MPIFGLFVVRPPEGVPTVAAIHTERLTEAVPRLKRLQQGGYLVKSLGRVTVRPEARADACDAVTCHIRTMFMRASFAPAVSVVW